MYLRRSPRQLRRSPRLAVLSQNAPKAKVTKKYSTALSSKCGRPTKRIKRPRVQKKYAPSFAIKDDHDTRQLQLGVIDPMSNIQGEIQALHNGEPCDAMLALLDPSKNVDNFFILQFIKRQNDYGNQSSYVIHTRWGRTGTSGTSMMKVFSSFKEAAKCFIDKFKSKTGFDWEDRNSSNGRTNGKYRYIQQDFEQKQNGYTRAKWQYWVDDGIDGKTTGWYDYTNEGSIQLEQLFLEHAANANIAYRVVQSGVWTYGVDLTRMTQTNISHPSHTSRRIRRCIK